MEAVSTIRSMSFIASRSGMNIGNISKVNV